MVTLLIFAAVFFGVLGCFIDRPDVTGIGIGCAILVAFL